MKKVGMMLRYKWFLMFATLVTIALAGAGVVLAEGQSSGGDQPVPTSQSQPDAARFKTHDDLLIEVGERVQSFGGMYLSDDNNIKFVYLLDRTQKEAAEQAIQQVFGRDSIPRGGTRALQGQYSMTQLSNWYKLIMSSASIWALPELVLTDLDEGENRIEIGVDHLGVQGMVEKELSRLHIPREAVIIRVRERPIVAGHTLQDRATDGIMEGGYQITGAGQGACTLGFNTNRSGEAGFITAGHCTEPDPWDGGVDGINFYQPTVDPANLIGVETIDPPFSSTVSGCPAGRVCRLTDSAFLKKEPGVARNLGKIAKTDGSITVDHANKFRIVKDYPPTELGETVSKVGRTSGWTAGQVSDTCMPTNLGGNRTLLCQHQVQSPIAGGDSGSPVFKITHSPSPWDVELRGVAWGGTTSTWFSPVGNVYSELALIDSEIWDSCDPAFNC